MTSLLPSNTSLAATGPARNLYVCGLGPDVTDKILHVAFAVHGSIVSTRIMLDATTGAHRGFGFVLFNTHEDATRAQAAMDGALVGSSRVHVEFAQHDGFNVVTGTTKVYVRNIPLGVTEHQVAKYFANFGTVVSVVLWLDTVKIVRKNAPPSNVAFVQYEDVSSAQRACAESNGQSPFITNGTPLLTKLAETSEMRRQRLQRMEKEYEHTTLLSNAAHGGPPPVYTPARENSQQHVLSPFSASQLPNARYCSPPYVGSNISTSHVILPLMDAVFMPAPVSLPFAHVPPAYVSRHRVAFIPSNTKTSGAWDRNLTHPQPEQTPIDEPPSHFGRVGGLSANDNDVFALIPSLEQLMNE